MKKRFFWGLFLVALLLAMPFTGIIKGMEVQAASGETTEVANEEYLLTSVDGEAVSTKGEAGRTTVLILGSTLCGNTQRTVQSIAGSKWASRADIRVVVGVCKGNERATLEEAKTFANTYGSSAITFCYDSEDTSYYNTIQRLMFQYVDLWEGTNTSTTITLPVTVLIDENDKIRNVLTGRQTADGILTEIDKVTGGDGEEASPKVSVQIDGLENYDYAQEILTLVNQERGKEGLAALQLDESLLEAAMQRAAEISLYYSHTRPDGTLCFTISSRGTRRAENIAVGQNSPSDVMTAWMNSEGHRANIMNAEVTSIGIGCFQDSTGSWNWVQFFDDEAAETPSVSGSRQVTRTVSIKKSLLHLQWMETQNFTCKDKGTTTAMEIFQANEEWAYSRPKLSASGFQFTSSNPSVASVGTDGIITLQGPGTAVVTASLPGADDCAAVRTVTVADHVYVSSKVEPTFTEEGYTLHTCSVCGDSYKDSIVPKLEPEKSEETGNSEETRNPEESENSGSQSSLSKVSGLKATSNAASIKLTWKRVPNAEGYYIYQYQSSQKKWKKLSTVTSGRTTSTVKKLKSGTGYRFAIKAYRKENGKEILSKSYASLYTATNPAAVKFKVTAGNEKAVVKWSKVQGADKYVVYYRTGTESSWKKLKTTKGLSFTKEKLKSGKTYTFTVKACKVYKGKTYTSSYKGKKVTIK